MVSYKAEGPSGRKTDGFLYKYRKGEEVRIVCVCHGNFLTPLRVWSCSVHCWCCPRMCSVREGYAMELHPLRQEQIEAQTFRFN